MKNEGLLCHHSKVIFKFLGHKMPIGCSDDHKQQLPTVNGLCKSEFGDSFKNENGCA